MGSKTCSLRQAWIDDLLNGEITSADLTIAQRNEIQVELIEKALAEAIATQQRIEREKVHERQPPKAEEADRQVGRDERDEGRLPSRHPRTGLRPVSAG